MSEHRFTSWENAVLWLKSQSDRRDLVLDAYYDDPLSAAAERYYRSSEWQAIRQLLRGRSGAALDVGAGRGIASYALAREGFDVTALEPDKSDVVGAGAIRALAEEHNLAVRIVEAFSERLPFEDGQFDVIFARAVLHHMSDLEAACSELARILKPGGLLIAIREHVISRPEDLAAFLDAHPLHHLYGGEHAFMLKEYRMALLNSGLRIVRQFGPLDSPINYAPYTSESLRDELAKRIGRTQVLYKAVKYLFRSGLVFSVVLKIVGYLDNRPGRHFSFICEK